MLGTSTRRRVRVLGGLAAASVLGVVALASCSNNGSSGTYLKMAQDGQKNGTTPWFCHSTGDGGDMGGGHGGMGHNDYYSTWVKGDLSATDCVAVGGYFDNALAYAKKWPTKGSAEAAGFTQAVQFVPGLGTHHMSIAGAAGAVSFNPNQPFFLQYDGPTASAPIAGMSWFVLGSATSPPEPGWPGKNDFWHTHSSLCYKMVDGVRSVIANEITDAECSAQGGVNTHLPGAWMTHAWIIPGYEDKYDVFSGAYMCLQGKGPGPSQNPADPCHDDHSDPEHGGTHDNTGDPTTTMMAHDH